uniref:Uncharacterized protein n=1 Tax=Oryza sativa subsp. japonica TaxID=39947 RepID=Q8LI62_ORYSJ|nr:hypothetical protein [Oryza sativa Japonica Group]
MAARTRSQAQGLDLPPPRALLSSTRRPIHAEFRVVVGVSSGDEPEGDAAAAGSSRRRWRGGVCTGRSEVTLALRTGLRDAKADFFFLRARGLRSLLGFLRSTASATDD